MNNDNIGPQTEFSRLIHANRYLAPGEVFDDMCVRWSRTLASNERDFRRALEYTRKQLLLPGGRQQHSMGRNYNTTAYNCFVGGTIDDSFSGIMDELKDSGMTLRTGGGVGWNFSTLRPRMDPIRGLGHSNYASGPVSFMHLWDTMCGQLKLAHRRGAMMGVLRVDHPDIMEFIGAKRGTGHLTNFNISVGVTREFMEALDRDGLYDLKFAGTVRDRVRAVDVWSKIMESNWDWAEPGVLFIDRINQLNPLYYCESISATNPCGEQPLPPYGSCLLGSINIVKLVNKRDYGSYIDMLLLRDVVDTAVRCFDNVPEHTVFPLARQREEALNKRRMGLGVTGMANALEIMGLRYGTQAYLAQQEAILMTLAEQAYQTSIELAKEKGPFPLFDADLYCQGQFMTNILPHLKWQVRRHGLRNSHLTSIAPTGTISLAADCISSGIEPPYALNTEYTLNLGNGPEKFVATDYAKHFHGIDGRTANEVSAEEHIDVLCSAQQYVDSSVSKTCNVTGQIGSLVGTGVPYKDFIQLYKRAYDGGAKGCTTFNRNGKLMGVRADADALENEGAACRIDPETGLRSCDE